MAERNYHRRGLAIHRRHRQVHQPHRTSAWNHLGAQALLRHLAPVALKVFR